MLHPKVIILMGTYNGQQYLAEQLDSIRAQTHQHWEVWVSDDGSSDATRQMLKDYQTILGDNVLRIFDGPKKGFCANFMSLVCKKNRASGMLDAEPFKNTYFAYADQDDIWHPLKLQTAVDWLNTIPQDTPALYCGRTRLVNQDGEFIGYSPLFEKKPSFLNALMQSIGGGNTMVFNKEALSLLQEAGEGIKIVAHDWWTYQVVTGAGGIVHYDPNPMLDYRQHGNNQIGGNVGLPARIERLKLMLTGRFKLWNDWNFHALLSIKHRLTEQNAQVLMTIIEARKQPLFSRLKQFKQLGIYRQTCSGNLGLIIAACLKKI